MNTLCIAAAAVSVMVALGQLIRLPRSTANIYFACLMAGLALFFGTEAARYAGITGLRLWTSFPISFFALGGALLYQLFMALSENPQTLRRLAPLLLVAVLPAALADALGFCLPGEVATIQPWLFLRQALHFIIGAMILGLCLASLFHVFKLYFPRQMTRQSWAILVLAAAVNIAFLVSLVASVVANQAAATIAAAYLAVVAAVIALLDYRFPDALGQFRRETVKRRYARSVLAGLDIEGLTAGMSRMMRQTAAFRSETFSLGDLADRMGLSPHQVSELLNDRMGINFSTYINGFRVDLAKDLLRDKPEMTILAIALEVGFGNKTSFNATFKRQMGMTPRDFRDGIPKRSQQL